MTEVRKYRKKPVVIEAMRVTQSNAAGVVLWINHCGGYAREVFTALDDRLVGVDIDTLKGLMGVSLGDYVVRGIKGEFYPVKPDIFEATYEVIKPEKETK